MPIINGKEFPYTKKGIKAAKTAAKFPDGPRKGERVIERMPMKPMKQREMKPMMKKRRKRMTDGGTMYA